MPRSPGEGWMLLCHVWVTQIHHPTPDITGILHERTVLVQAPFLNWVFFCFVLTLQWNPFIPCLAEHVKLFYQGSWMQGKLGWGFLCPELLCAGVVCVVLWLWGPNSASLRSSQSVARPVSSDPSLPLPSCPVDRRKSPWFLWSFHLPALFFWQHCSIQGSEASLFHRENSQCENLPWAKLAQPCCPWAGCIVALSPSPSQSSGVPVASSAVLKRMHRWNLSLFPQHSPGTLDHLASLIIVALFWCAVQWSVQVHKLHTGPLGTGEMSFPESE